MNQLVNIIYLWVAIFYLKPMLMKRTNEPLLQKIFFLVLALAIEFSFHAGFTYYKTKKFDYKKSLDSSFFKSLLLLLGLMIFNDLSKSQTMARAVPNLHALIQKGWVETLCITAPFLIMTTGSCLLKPYQS